MKCPRDGTKLQRVDILGIELDKCHKCDGLWFDRGELERLRDAGIDEIEKAIERKYGDPQFEEGEVAGYMRCPRCEEGRLIRFSYTYVNPVHVDRCDKCLGIWVDDGELDAIIGEKKQIDEMEDPTRLKKFLGAMGRFARRA